MKIRKIMVCLGFVILLIGISSYGDEAPADMQSLYKCLKESNGKIMSDKTYQKKYSKIPVAQITVVNADGSYSFIDRNDYGEMTRMTLSNIGSMALPMSINTLQDAKQYKTLNGIRQDTTLSGTIRFVAVHILRHKHLAIVDIQSKDPDIPKRMAEETASERGLLREWLFPTNAKQQKFASECKLLKAKLKQRLKHDYARLSQIYGKSYVAGKSVRIHYLKDRGFVVYQLVNNKVVVLEDAK